MSFFDDLYSLSKGFEVPVSSDNVVHPYTLEMIKECLDSISRSPESRITKYCRIFVDGNQLGPFRAKNFIDQVCKYEKIKSVEWDEISNGKDFLIFINFAAIFSSNFRESTRNFIKDFFQKFEPEGVSIEHHIIIGKYDETPFGVHIDDSTDRVLHFNLGPYDKKMILWSRDEYLKTHKGDLIKPLKSVDLKESKTYSISKEGCFFLPADYYHVGTSNEGVSIVVSLAFSRLNYYNEIKSMCEIIRLINGKNKYYIDFYKNFSANVDVECLKETWDSAYLIGFDKLQECSRALNRSNNYFSEVFPLDKSLLPEKITKFTIPDLNNIQMVKINNKMHVFSRGHYAFLINESHINFFCNAVEKKEFYLCQSMFERALSNGDRGIALLVWLKATKAAISNGE